MTKPGAARRLPGVLCRGAGAVGLATLSGIAACAFASPTIAAPAAPASQELVVLLDRHPARAAPDARAHRIEAVSARRPLTGARTVLPVLGRSGREDSWVRVRLPGRPNGHTGWIATGHTRAAETAWRLRVAISARRVTVYFGGRAIRRFRAVVGKPSTPTPRGRFFVEEAIALSAGQAGAPFALATSARSNALQEFDGGPGQIALHGTRNLTGAPGTAVSHGCVRLGTHAISWLARRIGAGVPLTIVR
jgi:lipoprotein-anchoring transpeptidase ErfK/SrfK